MSMGIQSFDNLHDNRVLRYCADFEAHRDQLPVLLTEAVHFAEKEPRPRLSSRRIG